MSDSKAYAPAHGGYPGTVETRPAGTVRALIVTPDGKKEHRFIKGDLDTLSEIVDGFIEYVFVTYGVHAYCNEEGKLDGLPFNIEATRLAGGLGVDVLCGTVVFLGDGEDGEEGDLPAEWLNL